MRIGSSIVPGISALGVTAVLLAGCSKPQVETYIIPPMPPRLKAPDHWREVATSATMSSEKQRFEIELALEEGNATALATLTVLPGKGDMTREEYLRINVNRWRRQLGMDKLAEEESLDDHISPVVGMSEATRLVDVNGTLIEPPFLPSRTVGVLVPRVNALWVYKLSGHPEVVDQERDEFIQLLPEWR